MPFVFKKAQKAVSTLLIVSTFMFLAILILVAQGSSLLEFKDRYYTVLNEGYGLSSGSSIRYKGLVVGRIRSIELTPEDNIRVEVEIFRKYSQLIRDDSVFKVTGGLIPGLGGAGITLLPSLYPEAPPLEPGSMVLSSDMKQGQDIMAELQRMDPGDDIMLQVQSILDGVDDLRPVLMATMMNVRDSTGSVKNILAQLEKDIPSAAKEMDEILVNLNSILEDLNEMTEDDIRKIVLLIQENLIDMKKVMRNLPLGMGTGRDSARQGTSISGGDR